MPMDRKNYPKDWPEIRERILARSAVPGDRPRCEVCGVVNYDVGYWQRNGDWHQPYRGSGIKNTFKAAEKYAFSLNLSHGGFDEKYIVIVLTIMHLNHDTKDNRDENLKAACQRCHNRHDLPFRTANRKAKRARKRGQTSLLDIEPGALITSVDPSAMKPLGQMAYEADVAKTPNYHDGKPRPAWSELGDVERWSWERPARVEELTTDHIPAARKAMEKAGKKLGRKIAKTQNDAVLRALEGGAQ